MSGGCGLSDDLGLEPADIVQAATSVAPRANLRDVSFRCINLRENIHSQNGGYEAHNDHQGGNND